MAGELESIVIVGAGQAGGWAAKTLRGEGFAGRITLIGEEDQPPYERPPLSKAVLAGEADAQSTHLFKRDDFNALDLDFRRGERAVRIDPAAKTVACVSEAEITYDRLLLTTGGHARPVAIEGLDAEDILLLRNLEDSARIRNRLESAGTVAIVGGGWIGLEVAATARKAGLKVHLFELADRLCARAAPPMLSDYLMDLHHRNDIDIHLETAIASSANNDGGFVLTTNTGFTISADLIIAGVGLIPNDQLAADAGLDVDNGIVTNEQGQTSDSDIFAAGDVANAFRPAYDRHIRHESWTNAQNQGIAVAGAMLGRDVTPEDPPWFWSDQHDVNIQITGIPDASMEAILRGEPASDRFSAFYVSDNRLKAAITVNNGRDMTIAKRLIARHIPVDGTALADPSVALKTLLKR